MQRHGDLSTQTQNILEYQVAVGVTKDHITTGDDHVSNGLLNCFLGKVFTIHRVQVQVLQEKLAFYCNGAWSNT